MADRGAGKAGMFKAMLTASRVKSGPDKRPLIPSGASSGGGRGAEPSSRAGSASGKSDMAFKMYRAEEAMKAASLGLKAAIETGLKEEIFRASGVVLTAKGNLDSIRSSSSFVDKVRGRTEAMEAKATASEFAKAAMQDFISATARSPAADKELRLLSRMYEEAEVRDEAMEGFLEGTLGEGPTEEDQNELMERACAEASISLGEQFSALVPAKGVLAAPVAPPDSVLDGLQARLAALKR